MEVQKYEPSFRPTFEQQDRFGDPFTNTQSPSPLLLEDPSNLTLDVEIDTAGNYVIYERIGALNYRPRTTMTYEQFQKFQDQKLNKEYWKDRSAGLDGESAVSSRRLIPKLYISPVFDRIFGGNYVDITPTGFVNLDFGGRWNKVENPNVPINQQRNGGFNYNQQISMNIVGKVGEKLAVTANFDNNNTFDYQNNLKIEYTGYEEDIIKKIEIGNVSMPVANSLISGGQSLFGIKTQLQFGKLYVTALASRQQGTSKVQTFNQGSGNIQDITGIPVSDYDEYKHFFLGHFFRDNYNEWLSKLPQITSSVRIQNIEVYVVRNTRGNQTNGLRSIIALTDLGETDRITSEVVTPVPAGPVSNESTAQLGGQNYYDRILSLPGIRSVNDAPGDLKSLGLIENTDYAVKSEIRKLEDSEYDVNELLGYITLRSRLNEGEMLAVSYEYTYNGERFTVGELQYSQQGTSQEQTLILKMLKPSSQNLGKPVWDLAMKNIYSLPGARNLSESDLKLKIIYDDNTTNYKAPNLNEGANTNNIPLVQVLKLDQLNQYNDPRPDGNFDFIEGVTFDVDNGALVFPVIEPFGETLEEAFNADEQDLVEKYVFHELYDDTKINATQNALKNKFEILAEYEGRGQTEYYLDAFNLAEGGVVVTSGSQVLQEGKDYTVSYVGTPKIIITNPALQDKPIQVQYEETDVFNFTSKWLTGARLDYQFNEKINVGATVMHLSERTGGISRYSIGNEPVKNTKYGFDVNFQEDSRILTKALDALPLISTKEKSTVTFNGEFAQLISGTTNEVNGVSTSYVDDFESNATTFQLGGGHLGWSLGSVPVANRDFNFNQMDNVGDSLGLGYRRARLAWYQIDRTFYNTGQPDYISDELDRNNPNPYVNAIYPQQLFNIDNNVVVTDMSIFNMAYYPGERGPYNYNSDPSQFDMSTGRFRNPDQNFASITRMVPSNFDFNRNNIEYIEFWMMDPFLEEPITEDMNQGNTTGGKLYFNLGVVSEDVLQDNRHAFENGLPTDGSDENVEFTAWGRVTTDRYLTQFFDTDANSRANQDVGIDGLNSGREREYFMDAEMNSFIGQLGPEAEQELLNDLSSDDYQFYFDPEYDAEEVGILERYKKYNGLENNSPAQSQSSGFSTSATTIPDNEDLNQDNSLFQEESYFEYEVDLDPSSLSVAHRYIVDETRDEVTGINWYLFRIPIHDPNRQSFGQPSINYMPNIRMYMAGWSEPVVLRMANFQLVGSQWRKYSGDLSEGEFGIIPAPEDPDFELSVVGIEQNGDPVDSKPPYVIPPGISRDLDNTTAVTRRVNEQSLQICVKNLEDGDARAAFKAATDFDLVNYKRLKMFFHAQYYDVNNSGNLNDDGMLLGDEELHGFLRLSRDGSENYYEIELPLYVTLDGRSGSDYLATEVWPNENEIDLALSELYDLKAARNDSVRDVTVPFSRQVGKYKITVKGNPKLSDIQYMMIGVRNPTGGETTESRSACVWANELRVTDFDDQNGWAANARLNLKLADFADVNASTQYSTAGFGQIQDRISDRTREEIFKYDVSANVNVDKLIPWKTGIKIPMYVSYSDRTETPRFDPLDADTPLEIALQEFDTEEEREEYKNKVISKSTSRVINFIDVRKEKVKEDAKPHIYDIENFAFSYSYSDVVSNDQNTAQRVNKKYSGSVAWGFNPTPPSIEPFKDSKAFSSPYLQLIKDINFTPLPNNFTARASIDRNFNRTQPLNSDLTTEGISPNYDKIFYFDRTYSMRWNLFKNLGLSYNATVHAIIDEAEGDIDTDKERREIWDNITSMGRTKTFNQTVSANYRLPLDKIPLTDWISSDYRYSVDYNWLGTNISQIETFGNTVQNSRVQDLTGKFDLVKLYNKSKTLRKINSPPRRPSRRAQQDTTRQMSPAFKGVMRLLMSVRSVNVTYSKREGTELPGLVPAPYLFGLDQNWESPGLGFIFGSQDPEIRRRAANQGWLVHSSDLTSQFNQSLTEELNLKATVEPTKDFKIQVDMRRSVTSNYYEIFRDTTGLSTSTGEAYKSLTPTRNGSYSITFLPIATAFRKDGAQNQSSTFDQYVANIDIISDRLGVEHAPTSQDVRIPAFIAAYTGQDASSVALTPFPKIPMPNWRVDYAGLNKIGSLKDVFASINITHGYTSTFNINNYRNSAFYSNSESVDLLDLTNNILDYQLGTEPGNSGFIQPVYDITQVSISERFSPLIGVNLRSRGGVTFKTEYSRERSLIMDVGSNGQVTERRSNDLSIDVGVSKNEWKVPFRIRGRTTVINNEMRFRFVFTVRDTRGLIRDLEGQVVVNEGDVRYQIRPTLEYVASDRLNITMYFDKNITTPKTSLIFPQSTTAFGVQVRFSLAQ